jgi:hypothetical protein
MEFKIKQGVNIKYLRTEITENLWKIGYCCKIANGKSYIMTITSGRDGLHMNGSLHYKNLAIDIRRYDMKNAKKTVELLKLALGKNFDIVLEKTHIHIEYDAK